MKTTHIFLTTILIASIGLFTTSCSKEDGCTDPKATNYNPEADNEDGSCTYPAAVEPATSSKITFNFTHNFDGALIDNSTSNQFDYITENEDTLNITLLRYLVSNIRLYKANGDSVMINGYNLVDVINTAGTATGMTYATTVEVPFDTYTGVSFIFGFDEADNTTNIYTDLNAVNWNWPDMLGGGYHFMQMNGNYMDNNVSSLYNYHLGTAKVSTGVFEQNYFKADLAGITLNKEHVTMEIKMDIAEWYKNPNKWDLTIYNTVLMPNYTAQKLMQANGASVFSLGTVTQND